MQRQEQCALGGGGLAQGVNGALDFVGAGHEDQRVAGILSFAGGALVGLGGGVPRRVAVGMQRLGKVLDRNRKRAALGMDVRARFEIGLEQVRVERGRHDDQQQVGPRGFLELQRLREGDIAVDVALVEFVEQDRGHARQIGLRQHLAQEDAFGLEMDARFGAADGLEADLVADLAAEFHAALFGHALGQQTRREAPGLEDDRLARVQRALVEQHLRHLGGLARTGGRGQDDAPRALQRGGEIIPDGMDGQHEKSPRGQRVPSKKRWNSLVAW